MIKTSNIKSHYYTCNQKPFKASNLFGENINGFYVVFSYGYHWPLWVYDREKNQWYKNTDKRSVSTSKQQTQCTPTHDYIEKTTNELKDMIKV